MYFLTRDVKVVIVIAIVCSKYSAFCRMKLTFGSFGTFLQPRFVVVHCSYQIVTTPSTTTKVRQKNLLLYHLQKWYGGCRVVKINSPAHVLTMFGVDTFICYCIWTVLTASC